LAQEALLAQAILADGLDSSNFVGLCAPFFPACVAIHRNLWAALRLFPKLKSFW